MKFELVPLEHVKIWAHWDEVAGSIPAPCIYIVYMKDVDTYGSNIEFGTLSSEQEFESIQTWHQLTISNESAPKQRTSISMHIK